MGPYDPATGKARPKNTCAPTYTEVFGSALVEEAKANPDIVAITAAMEGGTGLKEFRRLFPDRFIDVGIAEEQAVGMASGLATAGKKPVVALYSTFLQRAIDQTVVDVSLPNLDVVFAIDRAGIVGDDGPTHHGVFDIAYLRMIPNMRVLAPSDEAELVHALHTALDLSGPVAIRYPRGAACGAKIEPARMLEQGRSRVVRSGDDVSILAFGRMVQNALHAADLLAEKGISTEVVDMRWIKPLDVDAIARAAERKLVVTLEEGSVAGGAGEGVLAELARIDDATPALVLGIPDRFIMQGNTDLLLAEVGLDSQGIATSILEHLAS